MGLGTFAYSSAQVKLLPAVTERQRPCDFLATVTPLLASGRQSAPPSLNETEPHFGFLVTVETLTREQLTGRSTTPAICACSFNVGLRCALATETTMRMAARVTVTMASRRMGERLWTVHPSSRQALGRSRCVWLGPGLPASHVGYRLRLLPSGPDLVHRPTLRRTWPSTPPAATRPRGPVPCQGIQLRLSGLRITGHR